MGVYGGPDIVTDGLVFAMDAANKQSYPRTGTTATDIIENIAGTLTGAGGSNNTPQWENTNGGVFDFDGTDDYINYGNISSINSLTSLTISIWCKKDNSGEVVGVNSYITNSNKIILYNWTNNTVYFGVRNGATNTSPTYALSHDSNYHNYTGVYKGGISLELYVDGISRSSNTTNVPSNVASTIGNYMSIGYLNNTNYTEGNIANMHLYNRDLSASEILQNYNTLKGRFGL
jgi:hypothetical protein